MTEPSRLSGSSPLTRLIRVVSVLSFVACASYLCRFAADTTYPQSEGAINDVCWAATRGNLAKIERLHKRGVPLDKPCWGGDQTPLTVAVDEGDPLTTAYLLRRGVDPNNGDNSETTPLSLAVWHLNNLEGSQYRDAETVEDEQAYRDIVRLLKERGGREDARL